MNNTATESPENAVGADLRATILEHAKSGDVAAIRQAWSALPADPPTDAEFYKRLVHHMTINSGMDALHGMLVELATELAARGDWKLLLRVIQSVCETYQESDELRELAAQGLRGSYPTHPNLEEMIAASKLEDGAPLDVALKRFLQMRRLGPGMVYQHAYWGEGVVRTLDLPGRKVTLDFPAEKGKTLLFEGVRDFLKYLAPDHFLAVRAADIDGYTELLDERPVDGIILALKCCGEKGKLKQSELKRLIMGPHFDEKWWTKWWAAARVKVRMEPLIDFDPKGGAHAEVALRAKPKTVQDEAQDLFFGPETDLATRTAAVAVLAQARKAGAAPDLDLVRRMLDGLEKDFRIKNAGATPAQALQTSLIAEDLRGFDSSFAGLAAGIPAPATLLEPFEDYLDLAALNDADHSGRALKLLMARDGDGAYAQAARLLPKAPVKLAQAIWKDLGDSRHRDLAVPALQVLFDSPLSNPDTYFWAVKTAMDGGAEHLADYFPLSTLMPEVLDALEHLQGVVETPSASKANVAAAKNLVSKLKSHLQLDGFATLCEAVEGMTLDQAQRMRRQIGNHPAFNEQYRGAAERQVTLTRKDLADATAAKAEAVKAASAAGLVVGGPSPTDSELHWCTARGRERKLHDLHVLNSETIPHNSREIEKARSEGDLKENAGYQYAKEQQKLLMSQSATLQVELASARAFVDSSKVSVQNIGFGCKFEARNGASGKIETYTVLGKFELDAEKNIFSYLAPFMQQFVGKRPGDKVPVKFADGQTAAYEVLTIENALAGGEWESQGDRDQV